MYNYYFLTLDHSALNQARDVFKKTKDEFEAIIEEESAIPVPNREMDGFNGVLRYQEKMEQFKERKEAVTEKAVAEINKCEAAYIEHIMNQVTPSGENFKEAEDIVKLLETDLVQTDAELERLLLKDKNFDNPCIRKAIRKYSSKYDHINEIALIENTEAVLEFGKAYFDYCRIGVAEPIKSYAGYYVDAGEEVLIEKARAFGIIGDYARGYMDIDENDPLREVFGHEKHNEESVGAYSKEALESVLDGQSDNYYTV